MVRRVAFLSLGFVDYAGSLANALVEHTGTSLVLVTSSDQRSQFGKRLASGIPIETIPSRRVRDPGNLRTLSRLPEVLSQLDVDLLHHQLGGDPWSALAVRTSSRRLPVVTTIHEVRRRVRDEDHWWSVAARRLAVGHSRQIIVLTETTGRALADRYGTGLPPVSVVPHGETGAWYRVAHPKSDELVRGRSILFFGRIRPYKGLDLLIEASRRIATEVPDFRLVVAGSGATADELFPAGSPSWADLHLGHVPDEAVGALFDDARAAFLPYREASQSGVAANAFCLGCPVVATDVGGLAEGIVSGDNGLVLPPNDAEALADAIRSIVTDDALAIRLRRGAGRTAARSGDEWKSIARATERVYLRAAQA